LVTGLGPDGFHGTPAAAPFLAAAAQITLTLWAREGRAKPHHSQIVREMAEVVEALREATHDPMHDHGGGSCIPAGSGDDFTTEQVAARLVVSPGQARRILEQAGVAAVDPSRKPRRWPAAAVETIVAQRARSA
jgi:hypothetical protein